MLQEESERLGFPAEVLVSFPIMAQFGEGLLVPGTGPGEMKSKGDPCGVS